MDGSTLRRWADDMEAFYRDDPAVNIAAKARPHADHMRARADLADAESGQDSGTADVAEVRQICPAVGEIRIQGGHRIHVERPYKGEGEEYGIYTVWEWADDPTCEERAGRLIYLWIGTEQDGPLAQWSGDSEQWYELTSNGNYGRRYAQGGTWSGRKTDSAPAIVGRLEAIMDRKNKIAQARAALKAAQLRVHAAAQMSNARCHERQAMHPAYDGQDMICLDKAAQIRAFADETLARANLAELGE